MTTFNVKIIVDANETIETNVEARDAIEALIMIRNDLNNNCAGEGDTFQVNEIVVKPI